MKWTLITIILLNYLQILPVQCVTEKTVVTGTSFDISCPIGNASDDASSVMWTWYKNGKEIQGWEGTSTHHVRHATTNDSGLYTCDVQTMSGKRNTHKVKVEVGNVPAKPPAAQCSDSHNTTTTCVFFSGENRDFELCWDISEAFFHQLFSDCEQNATNVTKTFKLNVFSPTLTTSITNKFGKIERTDNPEVIIKPDPPTITALNHIDFNEFMATVRIPDTWDVTSWLVFGGKYTQNGNTRNLDKVKYWKKPEVNLTFEVEQTPYSLVCLEVKVQCGILGTRGHPSYSWSDPSEPMCQYTPSDAPSSAPQNLTVTSIQNETFPELQDLHLTWLPPPLEDRNGVIDHFELILKNGSHVINRMNVTGHSTYYTINDLNSYESYVIEIMAWTIAGSSPPAVKGVQPHEKPVVSERFRLPVIYWMLISFCTLAVTMILARCGYSMKSTIMSDHLPDPYISPKAEMLRCLSEEDRPRFEPKEVFDDLEPPPTVVFSLMPSVSNDSSHTSSAESANVMTDLDEVIYTPPGSADYLTSGGGVAWDGPYSDNRGATLTRSSNGDDVSLGEGCDTDSGVITYTLATDSSGSSSIPAQGSTMLPPNKYGTLSETQGMHRRSSNVGYASFSNASSPPDGYTQSHYVLSSPTDGNAQGHFNHSAESTDDGNDNLLLEPASVSPESDVILNESVSLTDVSMRSPACPHANEQSRNEIRGSSRNPEGIYVEREETTLSSAANKNGTDSNSSMVAVQCILPSDNDFYIVQDSFQKSSLSRDNLEPGDGGNEDGTPTGSHDQNYENYVPFISKVHDTMVKLN